MDRVSVPLWGITLSGPLPVFALVGRYLYQLADGPQAPPKVDRSFPYSLLISISLCGFVTPFEVVFPSLGQVTYVLLTRSPLICIATSVRLACIRHAASVHPEPGSNSPLCFLHTFFQRYVIFLCSPESIWFVSSFLLLLNCQGSSRPSVSQAQRLIICVSVISSRLFFEKSLRSFFPFSRPP